MSYEKHGLSRTPLHRVWRLMKTRCYNPHHDRYKDYGGRGITVCDEWRENFIAFYEWSISNGYSQGLQIDRINNDGPYAPDNCRWTTRKVQANNRRTNHPITFMGETHTIKEWSEITGIHQNTIRARLEKGLPLQEIFKPTYPKLASDGKTILYSPQKK